MEILKKVTDLKAELDAMRPIDADRKAAIMQKLRLDWNFHSNHLEGNSLNYGETKALILFGITAGGKPLKDHFEMTGHDEAIKWVEDVVKENRPLTEYFIRELHKLILKEPYESPTVTPEDIPAKRIIKVGEYKSTPNHVRTPTGEIFRFATPEETPAKMHDLIEWYREKEKDEETHPLLLTAEFHYKFIRIHPFDDGNGRTARILMNFILMKYGFPPIIVRTEEKEDKYFPALRQADAGTITPFIEYLGNNLAHSLDLMIRGARGENIDEADDVDKEIALIEQRLKEVGKSGLYIAKSQSNIKTLYSESVLKLISYFFKQSLKFRVFYNDLSVIVGDGILKENKYIPLEFHSLTDEEFFQIEKRFFTGGGVEEFYIKINFKKFNRKECGKFDYEYGLYFSFYTYNYSISTMKSSFSINKMYDEKLSSEEIKTIVGHETRTHTKYINQKIEQP